MPASTQPVQRRLLESTAMLASLAYVVALGLLAAAAAFSPAPGLQRIAVDGVIASIVFDNFWGLSGTILQSGAGAKIKAFIPVAAWHLAPELLIAAQPEVWDLTLAVGASFAGLWLVRSGAQNEQAAVYRKRAFA